MGDVDLKQIDVPTDTCPTCKTPANRVYSEPFDAQGQNDMYICDDCKLMWPTEWASNYKYQAAR